MPTPEARRPDRPETIAAIRRRLRREPIDEGELERLGEDSRAGVRALVVSTQRRLRRAAAERSRLEAMLTYERELWDKGVAHVAGVDEVGMGPLAGPVVAAAVVLRPGASIPGIDDSKRLTRKRRESLSVQIRAEAIAYGLGSCSPEEIDRLNIFQAGREAMRRAVEALEPGAEHLLVDARAVAVPIPQTAIKGGDRRSQAIAAASILAKVARDELMDEMAGTYPGYGFERHRGYPTAAHLRALTRLGPTSIHRRSFGPVSALNGKKYD